MVNASISKRQIITINSDYELYPGTMKMLIFDKSLENDKCYGILKFYMTSKVNQFACNLVYVVHIPSLVSHVHFIKIKQIV